MRAAGIAFIVCVALMKCYDVEGFGLITYMTAPSVQYSYLPKKEISNSKYLINLQTSKKDTVHKARIIYKGREALVLLRDDGSVIRYEMPVTMKELPGSVQKYLRQKNNDVRPFNPIKIVYANGTVQYQITVKNKVIVFDAAGNKL